jgi:hypothetical protein
MPRLPCALAALALLLTGCFVHAEAPTAAPTDARGGHAPPHFDAKTACSDWSAALGPGGASARAHGSFPELDPRACFVPVRYGASGPEADPLPPGCGYPGPASRAQLTRELARYRALAEGDTAAPRPLELACALPDETRKAAARNNARTLARLLVRLDRGERFPYAAVSTFGFGNRAHDRSRLVSFRPGDACPATDKADMDLYGVNIVRAFRAVEARKAGLAPIITLSGGAVHSTLNESFLLDYLATCKLGARADEILLDPCADHTHTNLRNTGSLIEALGGKVAYVVTDDGLQSGYLQEWTLFNLLGGSIDQRSLRDFGHLLGSFRQASVGMPAGFWFTPFRFWAEPDPGLGAFSCTGRVFQ